MNCNGGHILEEVKYLLKESKTPKMATPVKKNVARQDDQISCTYSLVTRIYSKIFDFWYNSLHNSLFWSNFIDLSSTYYLYEVILKLYYFSIFLEHCANDEEKLFQTLFLEKLLVCWPIIFYIMTLLCCHHCHFYYKH